MSWLKLNEGFANKVKSSVQSFAAEVQNALTEEPDPEEEDNPVKSLQITKVKCEELTELVTTQDKEIIAQRKQILELQQKLKVTDEAISSKTVADAKDSWFWDEDANTTPSTSSSSKNKDEHGDSPTIVSSDLTNIPLDGTSHEQELQRKLFEKEQKLKKLALENAIVSEKLSQISSENRELNENIEELDKQHGMAVENLLVMKQTLQDQLLKLQENYDQLIKKSGETEKEKNREVTVLQAQNASLTKSLDELKVSIDKIEKSYMTSVQENVTHQKEIEALNAELKKNSVDLLAYAELKTRYEALQKTSNLQTDAADKKISERIAALEADKQKIERDYLGLQATCEELKANLEEKSKIETQLSNALVEKRQWEQDFHALQDDNLELQTEYRNLEAQTIQKTQFEQLTEKLNNLQVEKNQVEQDFIALQDEDLTLQTDYRNLKEAFDDVDRKLPSNETTEMVMLNKQVADYENELSVLNLENTKLKEHSEIDRNELEEKLFVLEENYAETIQRCDELDRQLKAAKNEKKAIEISQLKSENSNISTMNQQMSETYKILNDKLLVAELELSEMKNNLEQKVSKIQNLEQEKSNLTQIIENLKSHVAEEKQPQCTSILVPQNEVLDLLKKYLDYEYEPEEERAEKKQLEDFLRSIKDLHSKHHALERKLIESSKEITSIKDLNSRLQHEKETMKADLLNYEIECSELMKNNGVLLTQLENLQSNKLETIHENNEDNIVVLEKQLEECSNLNETLEENYQILQEQYAKSMSQSKELNDSRASQLNWNEIHQQMKQQIENLEIDKGNLLFEINELKADRSVLETEMLDYKCRVETSEEQHALITEDLSHVVAKLHAFEKKHNESDSRYEETINTQAKVIAEKEKELKTIQTKLQSGVQTSSEQVDKLTQDNNDLEKSLEVEKEKTKKLAEDVAAFEGKISEVQNQCSNLEQANHIMEQEKNDLINLITTKHNENVQYHQEIQRLGQLLHVEIEKNKASESQTCQSCAQLQAELRALKDTTQSNTDMEKLVDQVQFLKEKSDILTKNIMMEQSNQKLLNQEIVELNEQKQTLAKESDRLRQHLLEVAETHTMETVELQKTIEELRQRLFNIEHDAKQSSTAYTSASIRANQHAETMQAQCHLLQQQRDDIANRVSAYEDHEFKNQAALTNLQCALEQFQKDKDRDIEAATYRIQKELEFEKQQRTITIKEYQALQQQLTEAKKGLLAAARLSDQLEISHVQNAGLKDELKKFQEKYNTLETKMADVMSTQTDKVEKNLVKNLMIGYIVAPNGADKLQILKLISHVLELNQQECDKVGLGSGRSQGGWLGGILSGGGAGGNNNYNKESLAQAFVMFLEKESQPHDPNGPTLLNLLDQPTAKNVPIDSATTQSRAATPSSTVQPPSVAIQPIVLNNNENLLDQSFVPQRNSSAILKDILRDT